jgi:hypothetical protein
LSMPVLVIFSSIPVWSSVLMSFPTLNKFAVRFFAPV